MNTDIQRVNLLISKHLKKRKNDLTFGNMFKNERTYFDLECITLNNLSTPIEIKNILETCGYYCPDYRLGYAFKIGTDKKPIKILKVLGKYFMNFKNDILHASLIKKFNERLKTTRKFNLECKICITHNPYDVGTMSTFKSWTTCTNLLDGCESKTPLKQIQYGGMCAYLIKSNDLDIKNPIARIAIKRLFGNLGNDFIFMCEDRIYGDEVFGKEVNFYNNVKTILNESNKLTIKKSSIFIRKDRKSYSDADLDKVYKFNFSENDFIDYLTKHKYLFKKEEFYKGDNLSQSIIKLFSDYINWELVSKYCNLEENFIERYAEEVDWFYISEYQKLSEEFIEKFKSYVHWKTISINQRLSEDFISKYKSKVDWWSICSYQKLSEEFIEKHKSKIIWIPIWEHQKLSEKFIEKHKRKANWSIIFKYQKLSNEFIDKYKHKV